MTAQPEVLLVHPGGPFWVRRDEGVWSIPKGEYEPGEDPRAAAWREFAEELGHDPPQVDPDDVWFLGEVRQSSAKRVQAWAVPGDLDVTTIASNDVEMDWPRGSGRVITFPEIDRAGWFAPRRSPAADPAGSGRAARPLRGAAAVHRAAATGSASCGQRRGRSRDRRRNDHRSTEPRPTARRRRTSTGGRSAVALGDGGEGSAATRRWTDGAIRPPVTAAKPSIRSSGAMMRPSAPLPPTVVAATSDRHQVRTRRPAGFDPPVVRIPAQASEIDVRPRRGRAGAPPRSPWRAPGVCATAP